MLGLDFLRCVGEAVAAKGLPGLLQQIPFANQLYDIATDALKRWRAKRHQQSLREEIEAVARQEAEGLRAVAAQLAAEVAPDQPKDVQLSLELYLTQIPGTIRRSLMRADDPTGTTLPAGARIESAEDLLPLLPTKPPRFRAGDRPACLDGRWELVELLGAGGFGEVWKGRHVDSPALVSAFKFCLDPQSQDRLLRHEAAVLGQVQKHGKHPGIVPLEDFNLRAETPWLRYEFVPGGDLTRVFADLKPLPTAERVARVVPLLRELAGVVGHFHRLSPSVVHRDLKPANILLAGGSIRVADFGIGNVAASRQLEQVAVSTPSLSMALTMRGAHTPLYASPQQKRGEAPDPRDDVYALGVIGYQLLVADLSAEVSADFDDELRDAGVPSELVALLKRCVARDAAKRTADGAEMAALLGNAPAPVVPPAAVSPPNNAPASLRPDELGTQLAIIADERRLMEVPPKLRDTRRELESAVPVWQTRVLWTLALVSYIVFGYSILVACGVDVPTFGVKDKAFRFAAPFTLGLFGSIFLTMSYAAAVYLDPARCRSDFDKALRFSQELRRELAAKYDLGEVVATTTAEDENARIAETFARLTAIKPRCVDAKVMFAGVRSVHGDGNLTVLFDGKVLGPGTFRGGATFDVRTTLGRHVLSFETNKGFKIEDVTVVIEQPGRVVVELAGTRELGGLKFTAKVRESHV